MARASPGYQIQARTHKTQNSIPHMQQFTVYWYIVLYAYVERHFSRTPLICDVVDCFKCSESPELKSLTVKVETVKDLRLLQSQKLQVSRRSTLIQLGKTKNHFAPPPPPRTMYSVVMQSYHITEVFLICLLSLISDEQEQCPDGWVYHEKMCYFFSRENEAWISAGVRKEQGCFQLLFYTNAF